MASFSRGLLNHSLRPVFTPRPILAELSTARARLFTTSLRLRAAAQPVKNARGQVPSPKPAPAASSVGPSRYAFIKSLSNKQTPTTLYEAPSHFWFYLGCWTSGVSIIGWTALTGPTSVQQPEGVPEWVGWTFGVSYLLLGAMGFYLLSKTPNIVSSIRVLPAQAALKAAGTKPATAPLQMEITVKRMLPYMEPKVLTTSIDNVSLKSRFSLPPDWVPELRRFEQKQDEEARRAALRKFDMDHILTMPFRRLGRGCLSLFRGVRSAWSDAGFGAMKVDGKTYKVDITKGYSHDGFRTLERIVSVKD